jgi:SAM-dependent methyltransferase
MSSWLIDELTHAGPEHLDPDGVAAYDRKQGYPDPVEDIEIFVANGLGPNSSVLDMGAGTGQFALAAAQCFGKVVAVDVSPQMVNRLQERAAAEGRPTLHCVQAGFLTYTSEGELFDGVFTRNALHHLPDFWKAIALDRLAGLLKPGGVLRIRDLIYDFQPSAAVESVERWLDGAAMDQRLGYTREDLATHVRTEYSTFRWLFEPMLQAAGFEIVSAGFERAAYGAYTCLKGQGGQKAPA